MKRTWATLQELSRDGLIADYDREAKAVGSWSVSFIRDEIYQRDREVQGNRMEQMTADMAQWTREMRSLTRWIAGLTLANTVGVILTLWRT